MRYPNPCVRCGMCCLAESCPAAGPVVKGRCRHLSFDGDTALCALIEADPGRAGEFGVGTGCCIKARAINSATGITVDFASLPGETKVGIVQRMVERGGAWLLRRS